MIENLLNPSLLFFILGIFSVLIKSDLEIPQSISKFFSIYLLFSIGFTGGHQLSGGELSGDIIPLFVTAISMAVVVPLYSFFILRSKFDVSDAGSIAACYGSVSMVTFITAGTFLEYKGLSLHGYLVAILGIMDSFAIITGILLIYFFTATNDKMDISKVVKKSITNGSVVLLLGSLLVGFLVSSKHSQSIEPFTHGIFKGLLALFLLDMGIGTGKKLPQFFTFGFFPVIFAVFMPLVNGVLASLISSFFIDDMSDRFILSVLAASASYIAAPAAMRMSVPGSNPSLLLTMSLGLTFPVNITIGIPLYFYLAQIL